MVTLVLTLLYKLLLKHHWFDFEGTLFICTILSLKFKAIKKNQWYMQDLISCMRGAENAREKACRGRSEKNDETKKTLQEELMEIFV